MKKYIVCRPLWSVSCLGSLSSWPLPPDDVDHNDNVADDGVSDVDGGGENAVDSDAAPDDGDGNDHLGQPPRLFLHFKGICTSLVTG